MPMHEDHKKHDDEMLIVHKAGPAPDPKKAGGPAPAGPLPRAASLDTQELDLLKKQLSMTKDLAVRRALVEQIQRKFGNDKATEVVRELRLSAQGDDDAPSRPPNASGPPKGKS
jgi:hypothetical protein